MEVNEEIPSGPIAKTEIRSAILSMSTDKAPGIDGITVELLKQRQSTYYTTFSVPYGSANLFLQIGGRVLLSGLPNKGISPSAEIGGGLL